MAGGHWGERGGILGLLDLIEEHRGAVDYDFRARFHLSASVMGDSMGWGEAARLVKILRADPSSMIAAALEGWKYPVSRGDLILMGMWEQDRQIASGGKDKTRHPLLPFATDSKTRERKGNAAGRSRAEVIEILNAHRHNPPV